VPLAVAVHELRTGNSPTSHVFTLCVDNLRIGAGADGVAIGLVGAERERVVEGGVVPVASVAVPVRFC
jgi:hypothetical protein